MCLAVLRANETRLEAELAAAQARALSVAELERLYAVLGTVCEAEFFNSRHKCDAWDLGVIIGAALEKAREAEKDGR